MAGKRKCVEDNQVPLLLLAAVYKTALDRSTTCVSENQYGRRRRRMQLICTSIEEGRERLELKPAEARMPDAKRRWMDG